MAIVAILNAMGSPGLTTLTGQSANGVGSDPQQSALELMLHQNAARVFQKSFLDLQSLALQRQQNGGTLSPQQWQAHDAAFSALTKANTLLRTRGGGAIINIDDSGMPTLTVANPVLQRRIDAAVASARTIQLNRLQSQQRLSNLLANLGVG